MEQDGSLCLLLIPVGFRKQDEDEPVPTLGYVRRDVSGFLSSRDSLEFPDYSAWDRHATVEAAIERLVRDADSETYADIASRMDGGEREDPDDADHRALEALERIKFPDVELSRKASGMLVAAARGRVISSVADMLLVSSYDEVMAAVSQAVLQEVLTS
jgi:hypothetical protein